MIFKAERTSNDGNDGVRPIDESYKGTCLQTDSWYTTFERYKEKYGVDFKSEGINHREVENRIEREREIDCYLIKIDSLEELLKLEEKYGEIIIYKSYYNYPVLEIYDYYRE